MLLLLQKMRVHFTDQVSLHSLFIKVLVLSFSSEYVPSSSVRRSLKKRFWGASKMVLRVKTLATQPEVMNFTSGTQIKVEEENQLGKKLSFNHK